MAYYTMLNLHPYMGSDLQKRMLKGVFNYCYGAEKD